MTLTGFKLTSNNKTKKIVQLVDTELFACSLRIKKKLLCTKTTKLHPLIQPTMILNTMLVVGPNQPIKLAIIANKPTTTVQTQLYKLTYVTSLFPLAVKETFSWLFHSKIFMTISKTTCYKQVVTRFI